MSITDELRAWASVEVPYKYGHQLTAIADRIDAEHKKAEDEWRAKNGDMWLKGYAVCHEELMEGHPVIAASLEEAGWVKLPVDADGEYIHVGDEVEEFDMRTVGKARGEVIHILFNKHATNIRINTGTGYADRNPWNVRHCHRVPTVEDVLREFADIVRKERVELATISEDTIAEYAKRLTIAEGEDA